MSLEIKAPSVGESITEVRILRWAKKDGEQVQVNDVLLEIESDKATVEVVAESAGVLKIKESEGATVKIGAILGVIDPSLKPSVARAPVLASNVATTESKSASVPSSMGPSGSVSAALSPSVRKIVEEHGLDPASLQATGPKGRITKGDALTALEKPSAQQPTAVGASGVSTGVSTNSSVATAPRALDPRGEKRSPMSLLRKRIAARLVEAQHTAAILTTFNEVDLSVVNGLRAEHKDAFKSKHGVSLGYMSFFSRAVCEALKEVPMVNGSVDGDQIITRDFVDLGVAVGTPRGLVVPVIRDAHTMNFVDIEKKIAEFGVKAKDGKLSIQDMSGGTFTISNGGVYGSLLSTPILTPPQTGILGMHKIEERAVVVKGQIVARPMMYVALSYDHRLIDGKEAVTFLVKMKEALENPVEKLGFSY